MPISTDTFQWQPIETAPENEPLSLEVTGPAGEVYTLPFPCMRKDGAFFTEIGTKLQVTPTKWKRHHVRSRSLHPRYVKSNGAKADERIWTRAPDPDDA
jgi:hypothetical protein